MQEKKTLNITQLAMNSGRRSREKPTVWGKGPDTRDIRGGGCGEGGEKE